MLADLDLAASGANDRQIEAGYEAAFGGGLLVAGKHRWVTGPAGSMKALDASEFYLRLQPSAPPAEGQACGGFAGLACPDGQVCDVDIEGACGGADLSGTCKNLPELCTEQYDPVCGCDGATYGNDCLRLMAGAQLDHAGECAPADGIACGTNTCAAGEYCCNASCGMCAPMGVMCIQIACAE